MINWNHSKNEISQAGLKSLGISVMFFFKAKKRLQNDKVEFVDHFRIYLCTNVKEETTCYLKLPAFVLTALAHQHLKIILPNNLYLTFKVRPFRVLALKSRIGYQLVSKTYPKTLLKLKSLAQN